MPDPGGQGGGLRLSHQAELLGNAWIGLDLTPAALACLHMYVCEKSLRLGKSKGGQSHCLQGGGCEDKPLPFSFQMW